MTRLILEIIISWAVGLVLSLYVHELGHLFVGLINGWKLFTFTVGPIKFYRENMNEKIKCGVEKM